MSRPRLVAAAACCGFLVALAGRLPLASAAETDYLPDNLAWNGLSELADLARGMQLRVELLEELDWDRVPPRSTLLIIYPLADVDPTELAAFLGKGGRVLIADDFGRAAPLLERFGVHRVEEPPPRAARYHLDNPNLPVARRGATVHKLTDGVNEIITNHPTTFRSALPSLLGFEGDQQVMVATAVGEGTLVALSDPSVLINGMLRFGGNLTLATNLVRGLTPLEGRCLYLVTGEIRRRPRGARSAPVPAPQDGTSRFLAEYNAFLGWLNDWALPAPAMRAAGFVVACLTLVAMLVLLPLPRRDLDGQWLRPQGTPRLDYEEQVRRGADRAVRPALVLREELEETLTELLEAPGPVLTIHPGWVVRRVRDRWGSAAADLADRLLVALRQLPPSADEAGSARLTRFRARDLAALHDLARELLQALRRPGQAGETAGPPERPLPEDKS